MFHWWHLPALVSCIQSVYFTPLLPMPTRLTALQGMHMCYSKASLMTALNVLHFLLLKLFLHATTAHAYPPHGSARDARLLSNCSIAGKPRVLDPLSLQQYSLIAQLDASCSSARDARLLSNCSIAGKSWSWLWRYRTLRAPSPEDVNWWEQGQGWG